MTSFFSVAQVDPWEEFSHPTFSRRVFLSITGGASFAPAFPALWRAREIVRSGALGEIRLCRVPRGCPWATVIIERPRKLVIERGANTLALLGDRATLVLDRSGCHVFPAAAV